jgi:hypothetical protein
VGQGGGYRTVLLVLADPAVGRHRGEAAATARHSASVGLGCRQVEGTRFATIASRAHRKVSLVPQFTSVTIEIQDIPARIVDPGSRTPGPRTSGR